MDMITLASGIDMPQLGLGTYQLRGKKGGKVIDHALKVGYRHLDTAEMYNNEQMIGDTIKSSNIPRSDLFITSKVWTSSLGKSKTRRAFDDSLNKLQTDYLDLYLIHWPGSDKNQRLDSYELMIDLREQGRIRSVGVSNFSPNQIEEVYQRFGEYPAVNQIHFSPFNYNISNYNYCRDHQIVITAHTPLNKGRNIDTDPLASIGNKHNKTGAQVAIRWALDKNVVPIPKSANPNRIEENFNVFDFTLSSEEIAQIDQM